VDGLILAAGFGTRMGCRPKAFLQVGGETVLERAARSLEAAGVRRAVVVHNARWAGSFDRWRRTRAAGALRVETVNDGALDAEGRVGAVGDMRLGLAAVGRGDALLMAVDNVFTWPLGAFLDAALGADPVLAVRSIRRGYEDLGRVDLDPLGVVRNFYDGRRSDGGRAWAARVWLGPATLPEGLIDDLGVYCEEQRAGGFLPDRLGEFFAWLARRRPVRGLLMDAGDAWDVGTPRGLADAQEVLGP
jgi:NDP-sugar pyrophosphorylase family protein